MTHSEFELDVAKRVYSSSSSVGVSIDLDSSNWDKFDSTLDKAVDTETGEILRPFTPLGPSENSLKKDRDFILTGKFELGETVAWLVLADETTGNVVLAEELDIANFRDMFQVTITPSGTTEPELLKWNDMIKPKSITAVFSKIKVGIKEIEIIGETNKLSLFSTRILNIKVIFV